MFPAIPMQNKDDSVDVFADAPADFNPNTSTEPKDMTNTYFQRHRIDLWMAIDLMFSVSRLSRAANYYVRSHGGAIIRSDILRLYQTGLHWANYQKSALVILGNLYAPDDFKGHLERKGIKTMGQYVGTILQAMFTFSPLATFIYICRSDDDVGRDVLGAALHCGRSLISLPLASLPFGWSCAYTASTSVDEKFVPCNDKYVCHVFLGSHPSVREAILPTGSLPNRCLDLVDLLLRTHYQQLIVSFVGERNCLLMGRLVQKIIMMTESPYADSSLQQFDFQFPAILRYWGTEEGTFTYEDFVQYFRARNPYGLFNELNAAIHFAQAAKHAGPRRPSTPTALPAQASDAPGP